MFQPVSLFIGLRYSRSSKGNAFISFISFFSIAGIAIGLMALFTVSSVMNGFENNLKTNMLGLIPHVEIAAEGQTYLTVKILQFCGGLVFDEEHAYLYYLRKLIIAMFTGNSSAHEVSIYMYHDGQHWHVSHIYHYHYML